MRILITGSHGQLGQEFKHLSNQYTDHEFVFLNRNDLDITELSQCQKLVSELRPDFIINCAAYTAVDRAETEREKAFLVNENGPANLAHAAKEHNAILIHISTDYVYHIAKDQPLVETDRCEPMSVYGQSKLAGEKAIANIGCQYLIFRVSWLYSVYKNNFVKTMMRLGNERDHLSVVSDQIGTPCNARDLAKEILDIISKVNRKQTVKEVYNYSNGGITNWADFAREIFVRLNIDCKVSDISTEDYGAPAPRPLYSVLSKEKIQKHYLSKIKDWKESLQLCLEELVDKK